MQASMIAGIYMYIDIDVYISAKPKALPCEGA